MDFLRNARVFTGHTISQSITCFPNRSLRYSSRTKRLDPPYLVDPGYFIGFISNQLAKPPIPIYTELQFDLRSFDFVVLEHFVKYLRKLFGKLDLEFTG